MHWAAMTTPLKPKGFREKIGERSNTYLTNAAVCRGAQSSGEKWSLQPALWLSSALED